MEYWDVYDKDRNKLNKTVKRGDPMAEGEYYVCCEICVRCGEDKYLITRRHPDKTKGGMWEFTGGGVLADETTRMGAKRELAEELGINIEEEELRFVYTYSRKNYFMDIYILDKNIALENLVFQETEVTDAAYANEQKIKEMESKGEFVHSTWERFKIYQELM